jgi:integrase
MLTDLLIKNLPLPDKRREIEDEEVRSLYLTVQPSGAKSWAVRYSFDGTPRKATLGRYPAIDLATARRRAQEALSDVAAGKDPAAFSEGAFVKELVARWRGRPASQVTRAELHETLDTILDRGAPNRANRIFALLMRNWATSNVAGDRSPSGDQTVLSVETRRDRALSDDEIRLAWNAFGRIGWPFGPIGKLLLLTGARRDEIGSARWSEIDFDSKTWTVAKERSETGVARQIPLSDMAMRIIEDLPRSEGEDGLVFSTTGRTPVSGFSRAKAAVDKAMLDMMREETSARGGDPSLVRATAHWTLPDLRRTVATNLQRLGLKLEVAEAVLDDVSGGRAGIADLYQRREGDAEKRIALAVWANRLAAIVDDASAPSVVEPGMTRLS